MSYTELESGYQDLRQSTQSNVGASQLQQQQHHHQHAQQSLNSHSHRVGFYLGHDGNVRTKQLCRNIHTYITYVTTYSLAIITPSLTNYIFIALCKCQDTVKINTHVQMVVVFVVDPDFVTLLLLLLLLLVFQQNSSSSISSVTADCNNTYSLSLSHFMLSLAPNLCAFAIRTLWAFNTEYNRTMSQVVCGEQTPWKKVAQSCDWSRSSHAAKN